METKPNTHASEASAQPIKGLSKRAQQQLQPRRFSTFSLARPGTRISESGAVSIDVCEALKHPKVVEQLASVARIRAKQEKK